MYSFFVFQWGLFVRGCGLQLGWFSLGGWVQLWSMGCTGIFGRDQWRVGWKNRWSGGLQLGWFSLGGWVQLWSKGCTGIFGRVQWKVGWKYRLSEWTAVGGFAPRRVGPTVVHGVYRYFRSSPVEGRVEVPVVGVDCSWRVCSWEGGSNCGPRGDRTPRDS